VRLLLVRHADAEPADRVGGVDADRPLTEGGRHQAATVAAGVAAMLDERLHQLLASPKVRALETAAPMAVCLPEGRRPVPLASLAGDAPEDVVADLRAALRPGADDVVACVGHQPHLGLLAAYLTGADPDHWPTRVAKASVMELSGELAKAGMRVVALVPFGYLARMALLGRDG